LIDERKTVVDADRLAMTRTKRARSHVFPCGRIRKAELPHATPESIAGRRSSFSRFFGTFGFVHAWRNRL